MPQYVESRKVAHVIDSYTDFFTMCHKDGYKYAEETEFPTKPICKECLKEIRAIQRWTEEIEEVAAKNND